MERRLWLLSWKELKDVTRKVRFVALPIGVVEAHGPHLPLGTDFIIPNYLSTVLVEKLNGLLAPPIPYGVTTSLTGFPGCLSIEPETLRRLVFEVLRSLRRSGFDKIVIINGHGGSEHVKAIVDAMKQAWLELSIKTLLINWWVHAARKSKEILGSIGGHAGTEETAMIIAIREDLAKTNLFDESQIFLVEEGIEAFPVPGSILIYDPCDKAEIPPKEACMKFSNEVVEKIAKVIERTLRGWEVQSSEYRT
ncbi:MAG: hypothetical protein DRO05_07775 [Thermoproteota archaeon]|nr:MAG: hypothetical protein DRO05_07775 [Candidatus Korarchaeota archaeon]